MEELKREYLNYINITLPNLSSNNSKIPIQFNHCFARVVLDTLCKDCWYSYIEKPAVHNMTEQQLKKAIAICHLMTINPSIINALNKNSLRYRQKAKFK